MRLGFSLLSRRKNPQWIFGLAMILWVAVVGMSCWLSWQEEDASVQDMAAIEARSSFNKDLVYRRWAAMQGGIYVPPTGQTPPNPYLSIIPDRDVVTTSGKRLTLVNPAYMTRQVHELGREQYGVQGHITSLKPLRPQNSPDPWEKRALQAFEAGAEEVSSVETLDGQPYLRLMRPMLTEKGCLKCHAAQGYKEGDIRGGISVSVSLTPYLASATHRKARLATAHGFIGFLGLLGIGLAGRSISRSQAELEDRQTRLELALNGADLGTWDWHLATGDLYTNARCTQVLGYRPEEIAPCAKAWEKLLHPDDKGEVHALLDRHLAGEIAFYEAEHRLRHKSGEWIWILDRGRVIQRDENGTPVRLCGTHLDITARKRAQEATEASERRFRKLFEESPIGIVLLGEQRQLTLTNQRYRDFLGFSEEEILARGTADLLHPDDRDSALALSDKLHSGEIPQFRMEQRYVRKDGGIVWADTHFVAICGNAGRLLYTIGWIQDITERKRAEKERTRLENQLFQAQKTESIGQLAGGVAHDFNNMLGVILGHADLGLMKAEPDSPLKADLEGIRNAAMHSAELTRQLLTFARKQIIAPVVLDLNRKIAEILKMLQRLIGENIRLSLTPGANLWPVKVDPLQMDQILANLCVNARDAISGVGTVTIETGHDTFDTGSVAAHPFVPHGDYVRVSVTDDGCGIEKEVQQHIFEPFFTTKELGRGTGLGLATVFGAVKQNNGFIEVVSEPGKGSSFNIYLPRFYDGTEPCCSPETKRPNGGSETILLVEDDEMFLNMSKTMLERCGYSVLSAATADLAQTLARAYSGPIHLLLSDLVMPAMDGLELSGHLQALHPEMKVLFMSGYSADIISSKGILEEDVNFLPKPMSYEALAGKVREVLDTI